MCFQEKQEQHRAGGRNCVVQQSRKETPSSVVTGNEIIGDNFVIATGVSGQRQKPKMSPTNKHRPQQTNADSGERQR